VSSTNLKSMTGFGRAEAQTPLGHFAVELKSVNSRFLEARALLPPALSGLEHELRMLLHARVRRGKLDCRVRFTPAPGQVRPAQFNEGVIRDYLQRLKELHSRLDMPPVSLGVEDLLRLPGALEAAGEDVDLDPYWEALRPVVESALSRFDDERAREGAATGEQMRRELELLRARRAEIEAVRPAVVERFRERLLARIAELSEEVRGKLDPGRLELEVALFADRSDISEELTRLEAHLRRLDELLANAKGAPVGKALDFLIQEILREINTTASKLREIEAVSAALEMKSAVERLREQIQNLE
jgi:uncharacterized protein (TIGR00255 family)